MSIISQAGKKDIKDLDRAELVSWFESRGLRSFRADQVMRWLYTRQAAAFDQMTDIGKDLRAALSESFEIRPIETIEVRTASDGTRKYLHRLADDQRIESVLIPEKDHHTLCISTQVGCAMGCRFCMTGKDGLVRNLTQGEILGQILSASRDSGADKPLSNIVLMGMGEPLANYENVIRAVGIMTDSARGLKLSTRRITLSTSGLVPMFERLAADTKIRLAISLNASENATRNWLMPINRKYPIEMLIDACARYPLSPRDKITFEYILIKGVNDTENDARRLAKLLRPVKAKINLIPFNPHEGSEFERPDASTIERFHSLLIDKHYTTIVRWSKGLEISAACGQLRRENGPTRH